MTETSRSARPIVRRAFLGGIAASGVLIIAGCQTYRPPSLTEAVRRLLYLSSENAFARLTEPGGVWDESVQRLGLNAFLGTRGDVLSSILTSALFKQRVEHAFSGYAAEASYRAAPVVTEAISTIGISNAMALIRGGPTAATSYLHEKVGFALIDAMVPELSDALRISEDPLVGQLVTGLTGVDVRHVARSFAGTVSDVIWREIGNEEARIRANPRATNDPVLIGVFGAL